MPDNRPLHEKIAANGSRAVPCPKLIRFIIKDGRTRGTQHYACGEYVRKNVGVLEINSFSSRMALSISPFE